MVSKQDIRELLDEAEETYTNCFSCLQSLIAPGSANSDDVLSFQPQLAEQLYKLSKKYNVLASHKRDYIERKGNLNEGWFEQRMRIIGRYQAHVDLAIGIGKSIGDAFAWIFYANKRHYLSEHFEKEKQRYIPLGLGGIGEVEFINKVQNINDQLILYHGITSFLRIGDVSFIGGDGASVKALGEIKSKKIDEENISINLVYITPNEEVINSLDTFLADKADKDEESAERLSDDIISRLDRQIDEMGHSFVNEETRKEDLQSKTNIHHVSKLYDKLRRGHIELEMVGDGLCLAGAKIMKRSLYSKICTETSANYKIDADLSFLARPGAPYNHMYIGDTINPGQNYSLLPGTVPLFHWPLDKQIGRDIIFGDIVVFSIFNPSFFLERLSEIGFSIDMGETPKSLKLTYEEDGVKVRVPNPQYYLYLIMYNLLPQETVANMVELMLSRAIELSESGERGIVKMKPSVIFESTETD